MRTGERGKRQFTRIRLALGHLHLGTGLINFFDRQNIGKIKLRINALSIHIQSNCHNIKIASALAVAKQCSFDAVCSAQQGKFSRSNTCPAVIMRMNADNSSFPVFHLSTEIFDLIRICVRRWHFHCWRQIQNDRVLIRCPQGFHYRLAYFNSKIGLSTGKAFRRIFIPNIHTAAGNFFLSQLTDKFCTLHCDLDNAWHIFFKYDLPL